MPNPLWVPYKAPVFDPAIPVLMRLAQQGSMEAIKALEQFIISLNRIEPYALDLLEMVFPDRDFEVTTGPGILGGNEVRHIFKTGELFDLMSVYPMQRVKALEKNLADMLKEP